MYIDYYHFLKQLINARLPEIKHIDWYNNQMEKTDETKAHQYPAVFIEFENPLQWESAGNGLQSAKASVTFHLTVFDVNDNPEKALGLAQKLHKIIHGKQIVNNDQHLSTPLMRTMSEIKRYNQLKVVSLKYETTLFDRSTIPDTTDIIVHPVVTVKH